MPKICPPIWLPSLELLWSALVMCMAAAKNVKTLYAVRFFIGLLEASAYPSILTLIGNWYTREELGKRSCFLTGSAFVSQKFYGSLHAGLYSGIDGKHGLGLGNGCSSLTALSGFSWLKLEQEAMVIARMERVSRKPPGKLTWKVFGQVFASWSVYLFSLTFAAQFIGSRVRNYFATYVKNNYRYTVEVVNIPPKAGYGFALGMSIIMAWLNDGVRKQSPVTYFGSTVSLVGTIILSIYTEHNHLAMLAGWIPTFGQSGASALIMKCVNEVLSYSFEHRLIVIGIVETMG
ncbi:Fc.00g036280.m01.CDS01 [Cosmosporella sp. VM-42]